MKRFTLSTLVLWSVMSFAISGCDRGTAGAGKYQNEKKPQDFTELKTDGTCVIKQDNASYNGKYTIEGKKLTLKLATGDVVTGSIDGKTITDNQGEHWNKQ